MTILVTGSAASGKSALAEGFCVSLGRPLLYIATMIPAENEESRLRIKWHRTLRKDKGFVTLECYRDLDRLTLPDSRHTVLLECLGNLCANEMFRDGKIRLWKEAAKAVISGMEALLRQAEHLVVVTNNVFEDRCTDYDQDTINYIRALGEVNQVAAQSADAVVEAVCGLPLVCKGEVALS